MTSVVPLRHGRTVTQDRLHNPPHACKPLGVPSRVRTSRGRLIEPPSHGRTKKLFGRHLKQITILTGLGRIQILPTPRPAPFPFTQGYLPKGQPPRKAAWTKQEEPWARWGRRRGTPEAFTGAGARAPSGNCTPGRPLRGSPRALRTLALWSSQTWLVLAPPKHILPTGFGLFAGHFLCLI